VSLQVSIMKVLSGHPNGRAALADMNADLAILTSVSEWTSRMRHLALREPDLDIFSLGLVVRDSDSWTLTAKGFQILESLERRETSDFPTDGAQPVRVATIFETPAEAHPLLGVPPAKRVAARRLRMAPQRRGELGFGRSA
jgi:hypothetical protein